MRTAIAVVTMLALAACRADNVAAPASEAGSATAVPTPEASEATATPRPTPRPTARTTPRPTPEPVAREDLALLEQGYTYFPGDTEYVQYAVVFENPNTETWVAERTSVNITWYDAAGGVAGSESTYLSLGLPGQKVAIGGVAFDVSDPADMEVQFRVGNWTEVDFRPGSFTFEGVTTEPQQYGGPVTKGLIVSSFEEDQEFVQMVAVYKDGAGSVLGGESGYAEFVPAGGSVGFEISPLGQLPGIATTDVYASP